MHDRTQNNLWHTALAGIALLCILAACSRPAPASPAMEQVSEQAESTRIFHASLPELSPATIEAGERLQVVATTNIIADVVANVGGEQIELFGLIPTGADPHGFAPAPQDLQRLHDADVIFINGLGLEEPLLPFLEDLDTSTVIIAVNIGVDTIALAGAARAHDEESNHTDALKQRESEHDPHAPHGADPHTWFSVPHVQQWVTNVEQVLRALDPVHAEQYAANAAAYQTELEWLDSEIRALVARLSPDRRKLVTDHRSFGYFAHEYGFEIVGAVLPTLSTMASASAGDLATLQTQIRNEEIQAIFVGATVNPDLARQIAADLGIQVVPVYTESLSPTDGPAGSYLNYMRHNVKQMISALE